MNLVDRITDSLLLKRRRMLEVQSRIPSKLALLLEEEFGIKKNEIKSLSIIVENKTLSPMVVVNNSQKLSISAERLQDIMW